MPHSVQPSVTALLDDRRLILAILNGDGEAWESLVLRHQPTVAAVVVRVLEAHGVFDPGRLRTLVQTLFIDLERASYAGLRAWSGRSTFRAYLAAFARESAEAALGEITPISLNLARMPSVPPMVLAPPGPTGSVRAPGSARPSAAVSEPPAAWPRHASDYPSDIPTSRPESAYNPEAPGELGPILVALGRLAPQHQAILWLRVIGLKASEIASLLGLPQTTVLADLHHIARRFAAGLGLEPAQGGAAFAYVLGAATVKEQIELALRSEYQETVQMLRARVTAAWLALRQQGLSAEDLGDEVVVATDLAAAFADGSLQDSERNGLEAKLIASRRTLLKTASLHQDLQALNVLRAARSLGSALALGATCLAAGQVRWANHFLAEGRADCPEYEALKAIADGLTQLERKQPATSGAETVLRHERSLDPKSGNRLVNGFFCLCLNDNHAAATALEELSGKGPVYRQLYLLALGGGHSVSDAKRIATETLARALPDPLLTQLAEHIRALPQGRALPWELVRRHLFEVVSPLILRLLRTELTGSSRVPPASR